MSTGNQTADRIYYDEQAATEFTAEVTAIREVARIDGRQVWQIALDRTAFYPVSGGQPHDTGTLTATARSGASLQVPITAVDEDDGGEVWHTTQKPLQDGTVVRGSVDAVRRRDHMQQHTGQHLLSAVLWRAFGAKTLSFHLGPQVSTIDLDAAALSDEQLMQAEQSANAAIRQALPVSVRTVSQAEAEAMLADGLLRKLPSRSGRIRLIEIQGLDLNACGGTHVANTADLAPLLLRGTERVRGGVRLAFVCGDRAIAAAREDFASLSRLAQSLSTGTGDIAASVGRMGGELRAAAKERTSLLASLAESEALQVAAAARGLGRHFAVHVLDSGQPGRDAAYAKTVASRAVAAGGMVFALVAVVVEGGRAAVALAAGPESSDCGALLRAALTAVEGKGGGSREMAQGNLPVEHLDRLLTQLGIELERIVPADVAATGGADR